MCRILERSSVDMAKLGFRHFEPRRSCSSRKKSGSLRGYQKTETRSFGPSKAEHRIVRLWLADSAESSGEDETREAAHQETLCNTYRAVVSTK